MERCCQRDESELVMLGGRSIANRFGWYFFCPTCSTAYLVIDSLELSGPGASAAEQTILWSYEKGNLHPSQPMSPDVECHQSYVREAIQRFLDARDTFHATCYFDGSSIPVVGGTPDIKLSWCQCCNVGFAHYYRPKYGWRVAASFAVDLKSSCCIVRDYYALDCARDEVESAVRRLALQERTLGANNGPPKSTRNS